MPKLFDTKKLQSEKDILIYLNGYLDAITCLNSFCDDHLSAYVKTEKIQANESLEETVCRHLGTEKYTIKYKKLASLKDRFKEVFPLYSEHFIVKIAESRNYPFRGIDENKFSEIVKREREPISEIDLSYSFLSILKKLMTKNESFYELEIDWSNGPWYAIKHHNFVVKNEQRIIFIFLGTSD